jgi:hypothetical protein
MTVKNRNLKREHGNLFHKINYLAFTYIAAFQLVIQSLKHFIPQKVYSINKTQHTLSFPPTKNASMTLMSSTTAAVTSYSMPQIAWARFYGVKIVPCVDRVSISCHGLILQLTSAAQLINLVNTLPLQL